MKTVTLRPLVDEDRAAYTALLHRAFNTWYSAHGWPSDYFGCAPEQAGIFMDIYGDISPGGSVAAFDPLTGDMMGACFYHPRERHVSLGVMAVSPDYFKRGVGRALVDHIVRFTEENQYPALRLVGSAINMDSFSLYNRSGFVPRGSYHDLIIPVPQTGLQVNFPQREHVREAMALDVDAMAELEETVSGITRINDYRYAIDNPRGALRALVYDNGTRRHRRFHDRGETCCAQHAGTLRCTE